jgi:hypothetical protein
MLSESGKFDVLVVVYGCENWYFLIGAADS